MIHIVQENGESKALYFSDQETENIICKTSTITVIMSSVGFCIFYDILLQLSYLTMDVNWLT